MQFNRFQTLSDIFILIGLAILSGIIIGALGILLCVPVFKMDFDAVITAVTTNANKLENINIIKFSNLMTMVGVWLVSGFLFIKIRQYDFNKIWQLKLPKSKIMLLSLPIVFGALLIFSSFLLNLISSFDIPESIRNLTSKGNQELLSNMLKMGSINDLIINVLIIGLAPAVLEEIFFRGTLQRLLIHLFNNAHYGIICTSFIFAAIHLNVEQFIPMLFLALVFGYTCYYTKSIWPSIILHFLNNSFAVIANYLDGKSTMMKEMVDDNYNPPIILVVLSILLIGAFFYLIIKQYNVQTEVADNE